MITYFKRKALKNFQSVFPCLLKYEISLQMNALALLTLQIFEPGPV